VLNPGIMGNIAVTVLLYIMIIHPLMGRIGYAAILVHPGTILGVRRRKAPILT
jgi:hypothetical protein